MIYRFFGFTGSRGSLNRICTVSKIIDVVSAAFLIPFSSVISPGLIESTAPLALSR